MTLNPPFYSKLLNKHSTHPSPAARIYSPFGALLTQQSIFAPMMLWMEVGSLRRRSILLIPADLLWRAWDRGPDTTPQTRSQASPKLHPRSRNWRDTVHLLAQRLPPNLPEYLFPGWASKQNLRKLFLFKALNPRSLWQSHVLDLRYGSKTAPIHRNCIWLSARSWENLTRSTKLEHLRLGKRDS